MAQKYRIYINENSLLITDLLPNSGKDYQLVDIQGFDLASFCKKLKENGKIKYIILSSTPKETFKKIKSDCLVIRAAGGLVKSELGKFLFIYRNGKWDLPKGKLEDGEIMKETAVREVEEECGVKVLKREKKIISTYHVYTIGKQYVLKKTNWYSMLVKGEPKLTPQKEEGIDKAVWLSASEIKYTLKNTFPSIKDVLKAEKLIHKTKIG